MEGTWELFGPALSQCDTDNISRSDSDRRRHYEQKDSVQVYSVRVHKVTGQVCGSPVVQLRENIKLHKTAHFGQSGWSQGRHDSQLRKQKVTPLNLNSNHYCQFEYLFIH